MIPISASNGGGLIKEQELCEAIGAFMLRMSGLSISKTGIIDEQVTDEVWSFTHNGHVYRISEIKGYNGIHPTIDRIHFDYIREATNDKTLVRRWQTRGGKYWYELKKDDYGYTFEGDNAGGNLGYVTRAQAINYMLKMIADAKTDGINYIEVANDHDPDVTDATGYVVRVGDIDDYHVEMNLVAVAERLRNAGVRQVINGGAYRFTGLKTAGKDFKGNNFISLFHGRHSERHGSRNARTLTDQEIDTINNLLK